jgi:hypothetical protein
LYHLSSSLHRLLNIICAQSTFCPFSIFTNVVAFLLQKYYTFSLWKMTNIMVGYLTKCGRPKLFAFHSFAKEFTNASL